MSYCHEKGLFCEFARASGYCTSTGCNKLTTVTYEIRTMTPATNADHIRSMTDEELAVWLTRWCRAADNCGECPLTDNCLQRYVGVTPLDWLKQPYKEAEDEK